MVIKPIAHIENDYTSKFAVPRQSCLENSLKSRIVFEGEYGREEAFRGLDGFSHLWIIWEFDLNSHPANSLSVRPPRLGGNEKIGVFATRSPFRPNPLGLSSVRLEEIERCENGKIELIVSGADLVNGTPIYDIKPYIKFSDCHEDAVSGFADEKMNYSLKVEIPQELSDKFEHEKQEALIKILSADPRPAYHTDGRAYGFQFANREIKFKVVDGTLTVLEIENE